MEVKTLVYLLAAILWFLFKNREEQKKSQTAKNDIPNPKNPTESSIPKVIPYRPFSKPEKPAIPFNNKAVSVVQERLDKQNAEKKLIAEIIENKKAERDASFVQIQLSQIEIKHENDVKSVGNLIGDDLRNGKIDWRQAVVINELLRPAYLSQNINQ
jgi:hypothetical protein